MGVVYPGNREVRGPVNYNGRSLGMGAAGILFAIAMAFAMSSNRSQVRPGVIAWGIGLQVLLAIIVLRTPFGRLFEILGQGFNQFIRLVEDGTGFVFGDLGRGEHGVVFAFQILPVIVVVSCLSAMLYHLGVMQRIVAVFAWIMQRGMRASGAESLNVAANLFLGQAEAPLTIRPYLQKMTRSELMLVMTGRHGDRFRRHAGSVRPDRRCERREPHNRGRNDRPGLHHAFEDRRAGDRPT